MKFFLAIVAALVFSATAARAQDSVDSDDPDTSTVALELVDPAEAARLEQERIKLETFEPESRGPGGGFGMKVLETFFVLAAVCFLAYFLLGRVLPRVLQISPANRHNMVAVAPRGVIEIIDRLPLDPKRALVVVKVGESHFLVAMTEQNMTLLSKLDPGDLPEVSQPTAAPPIFGARFAKILEQRIKRES